MRERPVGELRPGMILAETASDVLGNPLLEPGTVLDENDIRTLKAWGVARLRVEDAPAASGPAGHSARRRRRTTRIVRASGPVPREKTAPAAADPPPDPAERLAALEFMFAPHAGNELMERLRAIAESQLHR
jgi:hypothetical protein